MFKPKKDKMHNRERFGGFYRGEVVSVDDPLRRGRVKVHVFGVFDGLPPEHLPWAIFADPLMGGQEDLGGFITPDIGSHVWVFFEEGDHTLPVYFAGAPARPHGPSEATSGEYPRNKVFKTQAGFVFEVDDTPGETRLRIKHPSGNESIARDDGSEWKYVGKDLVVEVDESVLINCPKIDLGEPSSLEQSVLGKQLEEWINGQLIPWLNSHEHPTANSGPPSAPSEPFSPGTASPGGSVWSKKNRNQ